MKKLILFGLFVLLLCSFAFASTVIYPIQDTGVYSHPAGADSPYRPTDINNYVQISDVPYYGFIFASFNLTGVNVNNLIDVIFDTYVISTHVPDARNIDYFLCNGTVSETTTTWNNYAASLDCEATPFATKAMNAHSASTHYSWNITERVVNNSATMITVFYYISDGSGGTTRFVGYATREHGTASFRPILNYTEGVSDSVTSITLDYPTTTTHYNTNYNGSIIFDTDYNASCDVNDTDWVHQSDNETHFHYLNNTNLSNGNHSIFINCTDASNNTVNITFWFIFDTVNPVRYSYSPTDKSYHSTNFYVNQTWYDTYLYRINTTIKNPIGDVVYNNYSGDLSGATIWYNISDLIDISNGSYADGNYTLYSNGTDTHTVNDYFIDTSITEKKIITKDGMNQVEYTFNDHTVKIKTPSNIQTYYTKTDDRLLMEFKTIDKKPLGYTYKIIEAEHDMVYLKDSPYKGHFILDGKLWYDCEGLNIVDVVKLSDKAYKIIFYETKTEVLTKSLGGLNEIGFVEWFMIDTTAPTVTLNYPTNTTHYDTNYLGQINLTTNENTDCTLNNSDWTIQTSNGTFFYFLNNTAIGDGNYSIEYRCNDTAQNWQNNTFWFVIDVTAPIFNITNPALDNSTNINDTNRTLVLDIYLSDPFILYGNLTIYNGSGDSMYHNSTGNISGSTDYNWTDSVDTSTWQPGIYTVVLEANDSINYITLTYHFDIQNNITVWVNDTNTGTYVQNFTVTVDGVTRTANGTNITMFVDANTTHLLAASKTGYSISSVYVYTGFIPVNITLNATSAGVTLYFYDEKTELLSSGFNISIEVIPITGNTSQSYMTDTGKQNISGISSGKYEIRYNAENYYPRSYYVTLNVSIIDTVYLYMINETIGDRVIMTIYDQDSETAPDITIKLLRYYVSTNSFNIVSMMKTDFRGEAILYVEMYDAFYKLQYENEGGTILKITDPSPFASTTPDDWVNLEEDQFISWATYDDVIGNVTFINSTGTIYARFIYSSINNVVRVGCLKVQRITTKDIFGVCNNCTTSAASTLTCVIDPTLDGQYKAVGLIDTNSTASWYPEWITYYHVYRGVSFGQEGLFLSAIFAGTMGLMGLATVTSSLLLLVVGVIGVAIMGFVVGFDIGWIYYLFVMAMIVIFMVRRGSR